MKLDFAVGDLTVHRLVELDAPFMLAREMLPALMSELLGENRYWCSHTRWTGTMFSISASRRMWVRTPTTRSW
ncbi:MULTISPECIES: hypothetical protein [unclassified Bradyrhizobium]